MYISLQIRLTCCYVVLLVLALCLFGSIVSTQAEQRAYRDLDATLSSRAASVRLGKELLGPGALPSILPALAGVGTQGVAIEVLDDRLRLLATTDGPSTLLQTSVSGTRQSPVPWDAQAARGIARHPFAAASTMNASYSTISYQGQRVRVYTLANDDFGQLHIIQTARSQEDIEQSLNNLHALLLGGGILVTLCAMLAGWLITRSLLARVQRITRTACSLSEQQSFSQRVADKSWGGRDELSILSETFNDMLDQLGRLYHSQQRFIADASHELRAPITSISCNLDLLAKAPDLPAQEVRAALADARVEADRMGRLVSDLLTLARADGERLVGVKKARLREQAIDLDSLLLEVFRQYRPAADSGGDELKRPPRLLLQHITPASVAGNADQLKQALVALVDNALKYTPAQGTVSLALSTAGRWAIVEIRDTGIGIASADVPLIFERFYRADPARSRDQGGSGLGLAIAWSIVQEHGGAIDVESDPAQGSTFALRLPLIQP